MQRSIYSWSKVASENDVADADIDWREGQFPDTVNDSARQMMGRNAEFRDDITGTLMASGMANAITLTANSAFTTLANGRMLTFRAAANNTGPVSLNVNGLGSKAVRAMGAAADVDLAANDLKAGCVYTIMYSGAANGNAGAWMLFAPFSKILDGNRVDAFPAGTRLLFQQSTAPMGWTKDTTHDNKALRLVNGTVTTGGAVNFTTAFSSTTPTTSIIQSGTVGGTALTVAQLPSHAHGVGGTTNTVSNDHTHTWGGTFATDVQGSHTHTPGFGTSFVQFNNATNGGNLSVAGGTNSNSLGTGMQAAGAHVHNITVGGTTSGISANHSHTFNVTSAAAGSDQAHTHSFTGEAHSHTTDLAVQYVDVIICEKAA
jgi:hypothetical protein